MTRILKTQLSDLQLALTNSAPEEVVHEQAQGELVHVAGAGRRSDPE